MIGCYNIYADGNKAINIVCNNSLFKKYREILKDITIKIENKLNGVPIYKINSNMDIKAIVDVDRVFLYNDKTPKVRKPHKCLTLIRLESISVTEELKYYPQTFLEELKVNNRRNARMSRKS